MGIRLASELQQDSIVDGTGIRAVIWTQGCEHKCPGCHNPSTHDMNGGFDKDIEELKKEISSLELQDGITFSGGDPFFQSKECAELANHIKSLGMNIWCYTGFTFEKLLKLSNKQPSIMEFLENIDVLVDGLFIISKRSYSAKFRGSSNQRIIDVKKSLETGKTILISEDDTEEICDCGRYQAPIYI